MWSEQKIDNRVSRLRADAGDRRRATRSCSSGISEAKMQELLSLCATLAAEQVVAKALVVNDQAWDRRVGERIQSQEKRTDDKINKLRDELMAKIDDVKSVPPSIATPKK